MLPTAPSSAIGRWLWRLSPVGEWNGQFLAPYSWPCCKRGRGLLFLTWSGFFVPARLLAMFHSYTYGVRLSSIYVSLARVPIPDPGILFPCLTLFQLKTMERMVDRYLREEVLAFMPLLLGWEIHGNSPSSARGVGWEGTWPSGNSSGCFSR